MLRSISRKISNLRSLLEMCFSKKVPVLMGMPTRWAEKLFKKKERQLVAHLVHSQEVATGEYMVAQGGALAVSYLLSYVFFQCLLSHFDSTCKPNSRCCAFALAAKFPPIALIPDFLEDTAGKSGVAPLQNPKSRRHHRMVRLIEHRRFAYRR